LAFGSFLLFFLHPKRSEKAVKDWGLLERLNGFFAHVCWKLCFKFTNVNHCLCGAHILRELTAAFEMGQKWADLLYERLLDANELTSCYGGMLPLHLQRMAREKCQEIIALGYSYAGGKVLARPPGQEGKRGKIAKPKYRNPLERLDAREDAAQRFMTASEMPFGNNDAEHAIRPLKLHDKISGWLREEKFAKGHCRMRGCIASCNRNGISASEAIRMLVKGEVPGFIKKRLSD
jgi:transposase